MRHRSGFSFRYAYGFVRDVLPRIETTYAALTDRGSCYGFNQWRKLCERAGKKPIFGFEVAVTNNIGEKKPRQDFVTLLALDGLTELNRVFSIATSSRKEPALDYHQLNKVPSDKVAVILGRTILPELLDPDREWFYAQGPSTPRQIELWAKEYGWRPIASSDNAYPAPEDRHAFEVLGGGWSSTQSWEQHILTEDELRLHASPEAFANRDELAERCNAIMLKPKIASPEVSETLEQWCERGAAELEVNLEDPAYRARYERETSVIHQLGFEDYFFIIADLVRFSRQHMFVGPARGSSCGSLVCYLMGITTVDPIKHDLMFERFIDPHRADLPDIDIDFSEQHRDIIFTYLADRYGQERVARLGTISYLREKSISKNIGAYLQIPAFKLEPVLRSVVRDEGNASNEHLPTYFTKTLDTTTEGQKLLKEFPEISVVRRLEGHPTHRSTHAAGAVVTSTPIYDYVAVDKRTNTVELDKFDAQDLEMLKIDALGLKQLSVFEDTLELIGKPHKFLVDLPLDDIGAFEVLNQRKFSGIFQYNGASVQKVSSSFTVENFEDMVATTSLARPGPMGAGGTDRWLRVRTGKEPARLPHPLFEPILGRTHGIVIYQEQVMQIGRQIGDMEWPRVTKLRKVVQYFTGKAEMDAFRNEYLAGATAKGIELGPANAFWDEMLAFGAYAFNRSHAVAYSLLSYWCCWLKAHHPLEFAAGMLNHEADPERQRQMLVELQEEGVDYQPFDAQHSGMKWQPLYDGASNRGKLLGPLTLVKGLGPRRAEQYLDARKNGKELPASVVRVLENGTTPLDTLEPVKAAVARNHPDLKALNIFSEPTPIGSVGEQELKDKLFIGLLVKATSKKSKDGRGDQMTCILRDDTGEIRLFINKDKYNALAVKLLEAGSVGKTLWAVKGSTPPGGGIVWVDMVRCLGLTEQKKETDD